MSKDKNGFTPQEESFLKKNFPAGEYSVISIMVRHDELTKFTDILKKAALNLAIMPGVKPKIDFATGDIKGGSN